jgi:hypothetical protein
VFCFIREYPTVPIDPIRLEQTFVRALIYATATTTILTRVLQGLIAHFAAGAPNETAITYLPLAAPNNSVLDPPPDEAQANPLNVTFSWDAMVHRLGIRPVLLRFVSPFGSRFDYVCGFDIDVIERKCSVVFQNEAYGNLIGLFEVSCSAEDIALLDYLDTLPDK